MTTQTQLNLEDPQTRRFVGEFLDARLAGILRSDWTAEEYIRRCQLDEQRKQLGGLSADDDDDTFLEISE